MKEYLAEHSDVIKFILNACTCLHLSAVPRTSACILYHKVIKQKKERKENDLDKYLIAATCLYMAAKLEEEPQKVRDVVNVCYRLTHPDKEPLEIGKSYWNLRDSITTCELILMRLFKFNLCFETPHKYLLHFIKLLQDWNDVLQLWKKANISQICWNLLNDSCRLPLIAECRPEFLATVIIFISLKTTLLDVQESEEGKHWYEVFSPGTTSEQLERISCQILEMYE